MTIDLEDCVLRPIEFADAADLYTYKNDPDVLGGLGGFSTGYSRADIEKWIEFHKKQADEVLWAIASKHDNRCIGHAGLYRVDHRIRKAEYAILIGAEQWRGRGVGERTSLAVLKYGFEELNLHRIELSVLASNEAALSLYRKLGFEVEGTMRDAQFRSGRFVDVTLMAILEG